MINRILVLTAALAASATAAEQTFDFKDPKGVNNATFKLDAPLEIITGTAKGVSGTITVDPEKPEATKGVITIDTKTLHVENATMKEHMLGEKWMDTDKYPTITFTISGVSGVKRDGDTVTGNVKGKIAIKGVEKELSVPVKATLLKDKLADRSGGRQKGDLLVVRTTFNVKRSEFNINPSAPTSTVSDDVEIGLAIVGLSEKK